MKLSDLWRRWQTRGYPEHMLTEAQAIEHVRQYAAASGRTFYDPVSVRVERRELEPGNRKAGFRRVYVMVLGTTIPMPIVEVDSTDGKILAWRRPSR